MTGTIINVISVLIGSAVGLFFKTKIPERVIKTVFQAIGLFTLALGVIMSQKIEHFLIVIFSLITGTIIGELIDIEHRTNLFSDKIKSKFRSEDSKFSEGMLTAFLLFCMGSMTILGAFEEGVKNDSSLLITKAVMDGFAAVALAASFGIGVAFSVIPLLIFQGGLSLLAYYFGNFLDDGIINELTATGGILLIGLGFNILEIKHIKIFNILPALFFAVLFAWLNFRFNLL